MQTRISTFYVRPCVNMHHHFRKTNCRSRSDALPPLGVCGCERWQKAWGGKLITDPQCEKQHKLNSLLPPPFPLSRLPKHGGGGCEYGSCLHSSERMQARSLFFRSIPEWHRKISTDYNRHPDAYQTQRVIPKNGHLHFSSPGVAEEGTNGSAEYTQR